MARQWHGDRVQDASWAVIMLLLLQSIQEMFPTSVMYPVTDSAAQSRDRPSKFV